METIQNILRTSVVWMELLAFLAGVWQYRKFKNTVWIYFIVYLFFIFLFEAISYFFLDHFGNFRKYYYGFIVIPFQFVFWYWLYAKKLFLQPRLFYVFTVVYLLSFIPYLLAIEQTRVINSLSYTIGVLLFFVLIVIEFFNQIKSEKILQFRENIRFYINLGVVLFYVGTLPFFAFDAFSFEHTQYLWTNYYTFFLVLVNVIYLFFIIGLVWGKPNL